MNNMLSAERVFGLLGRDGLMYAIDRTNPASMDTALLFYDIPGVVKVGLDRFKVQITISPAFNWCEIEQDVINRLCEQLNWSEVEELKAFFGAESTAIDYEVEQVPIQ